MRKKLALFLALVMITASLVGCGGGKDKDTNESGQTKATDEQGKSGDTDTLVVLSSGAFQGAWDPSSHSILSNRHLEWNVYDRAVAMDADNNYVPALAESWEYQADGYTLRMKMREDVKFHDGSDMTAEDVAASIEYLTRPDSARAADWGGQFKAKVVDEYTVDIWAETEAPSANLLTMLATDPIMSADDIEAGTLNTDPNGCGPYKFVKYENETCYLEAFEEYWDKENAAKMKYCEYKYVSEPATRLAALQTGDAHLIERVDIEQVPQIEADDTIDYLKVNVDEQKYMIFKCTQDVMQEELVRKAISYAIDRETIVNDIMGGYAVLADSYVSHVSHMYAEAEGMPTYDPEKAKELLAEAGYPGGEGLPTITYITSTGFYPKTKEYAEYIVSNLKDVGIEVDLIVMESAAWEAALYEEDSCLMVDTGWMNTGGDVNMTLTAQYKTTGRCNFSSYPEVDAALNKESMTVDPKERLDVIKNEVYPLLVETNTNLPLFDSVMVFGYSKNLEGLDVRPTSQINFAQLSVK